MHQQFATDPARTAPPKRALFICKEMIYPENFESKIGFDRIRNQISALCISDGARAKLAELHFSTSREEIVRQLEEAFEMRTILMLETDFPENNYVDTAPFL